MKKIIFCAGKWGVRALISYGEENVYCFCDTQKAGGSLYGKKIISITELRTIASEYEIVVAYRRCDEIIELLIENGINQVTIFKLEEDFKSRIEIRELELKSLIFPHPMLKPEIKSNFQENFEDVIAQLKKESPSKAFDLWKILFERGRLCYENDIKNNCAVDGHYFSNNFKLFFQKYINAFPKTPYILDIGCGPQEVPSYLEGLDLSHIFGVDPLPPTQEHPFQFYQTIAEYLPFEDESFQIICMSTSFDHVLLIEKVVKEAHRVLCRGGVICMWVGICPGSKPFDVHAEDILPIDDYHLFHVDSPWFEELWKDKFRKIEHVHYSNFNAFYAFQKRD